MQCVAEKNFLPTQSDQFVAAFRNAIRRDIEKSGSYLDFKNGLFVWNCMAG